MQSEEMGKVEQYFGKVKRVNEAFNEKLLSYFDDVLSTAQSRPRHLVTALRVVMNQVHPACFLTDAHPLLAFTDALLYSH